MRLTLHFTHFLPGEFCTASPRRVIVDALFCCSPVIRKRMKYNFNEIIQPIYLV